MKVTDDWQTQNKSVGCIPHTSSSVRNMWKLYDELMTYDKVTNSQVDVQKLTYKKVTTNSGETLDSFYIGFLVKNLTLSFALVIPIFCNRSIACVSGYIFAMFCAISLVRMRRNNVYCASGLSISSATIS